MKLKQNLPKSYDFIYFEEDSKSYFFKTNSDIIYEVKFKEFFYFFSPNKEYSSLTYEFAIEISENPLVGRPPLDSSIPITIANIFYDFFDRIGKPLVIYVCDSSDGKQFVRQRKFTSWFYEFQKPNFFKIDTVLPDKKGETVPVSLILNDDNPYFIEIINDFKRITGGYQDK